MSTLNVFKNSSYSPWKYPGNWSHNAKLFFRRFKWAGQRVTRGYADCDIWDMDTWLLNLFHDSLNYFAENHCSYPGDHDFPDDEIWTKYLKDIAQKFYQANENNNYYPTPEEDKWHDWNEWNRAADMIQDSIENPYRESYMEEDHENSRKRLRDFAEAWALMGEEFFNLWD